jgi:DNA invertase Pin-like site-specific DNA recombinase
MIKKIAIYTRVSKDEAASDGSMQDPSNQLIPLRKYAEAFDYDVKFEFVDRASGGSANRPEFQKMLSEVRQRHIDLVLVWSLDRFSREGMVNTLKYIQTLKNYKCDLKSLQESWLDTTQEGVAELLLAIFSWVAKEERRKISERTKAGLARLKAQGVKLGRPRKKRGSKK